jgi:hypothetical protein
MERLRHLYGWDAFHTNMTLAEHNDFKYPDGIVLTMKTAGHADHYFVERVFALQLSNSIKESMLVKPAKPKHAAPAKAAKPAEPKPTESKSKKNKKK